MRIAGKTMANSQLQKQQPLNAAPKMLPQTALMRFLYLGNVQPVHICSKHDPTYEHVCTQLICIRDMLAGDQAAPPTYPFSIIERTLSADSAVLRRTESIIALAYCVRCVDSEPLRALVYSRLAELLTTDTDLFRFVHWATRLKANAPCASNVNGIAPEAAGSTGFGRGMRRAVAAWYHARSPLQLVDIVGRHRGQFRWTHCDLLAMCHVKFEPADQRLMVIQSLHQRGVHILRQLRETFDSGSVERTPAVRRLEQYLLFKVCESTDVAARMFIDNGFRYEHVPSHLRASAEFWASVGLDRLPFLDLLRVFLTLNDQNALESAEPLCAAMLRRLASAEAATEADDGAEVASAARVQPLALLSLRNAYGKGVRPAEVVSANWYRKKHADEDGNMRPGSAPVLHCFARAINNAFNNVPDMGRTELFVTLDLRSASKRRRVFNMEHLNCYEAMVLLALALVKRGRTTVFAFTDSTEQQQLKMLKLSADDDFETAMLKCENFTVSRSEQRLGASIRYSLGEHGRTFITIMDSAARIVRNGLRDFAEFEQYRAVHPESRYVMMNLGRHTHDLHSYPGKGVLEICGLSPNVLSLVQAFINNKFH